MQVTRYIGNGHTIAHFYARKFPGLELNMRLPLDMPLPHGHVPGLRAVVSLKRQAGDAEGAAGTAMGSMQTRSALASPNVGIGASSPLPTLAATTAHQHCYI